MGAIATDRFAQVQVGPVCELRDRLWARHTQSKYIRHATFKKSVPDGLRMGRDGTVPPAHNF